MRLTVSTITARITIRKDLISKNKPEISNNKR